MNGLRRIAPLVLIAACLGPAARGGSCTVTALARLIGVPPSSEDVREATLEANTGKLKVTLTMDRPEYIPGQAAQVRVSIVNPTRERLEVREPFGNDILCVLPGGPGCWCGRGRTPTRWFEAGETIEQTFHSYDPLHRDWFAIPENLGDYKLVYSYGGEPANFRVIPGDLVLLSASGYGRGQGAILHAGTTRVASSSDPASVGQFLEIYGTGLVSGCIRPRQVTIGGRVAEILYYGSAPASRGLNQVNARVPSGVVPGPAVPVQLTCLGRASNEVTIGVQ